MAHTANTPGTKDSLQNLANWSFDKDFNVFVNGQLTYNPVSNTMERVSAIQGNASLVLAYTDDKLTSLTKTIDGTEYVKTLSYTGSDLTGVSAWSEV